MWSSIVQYVFFKCSIVYVINGTQNKKETVGDPTWKNQMYYRREEKQGVEEGKDAREIFNWNDKILVFK